MGLADLSRLLESLPSSPDPRVIVGLHPGDDAGVFQLTPDLLIVQTVDFFPPVLDDPYWYGQVAAANSLSDVYAMGGTPVTALNIVAFPLKDLGISVLTEILRGGSDKVAEAGAALLGGHTVTDKEPKYGLAVTGVVERDRLVTNGGASPGDLLILTKPIGTGIATTAIKQQCASEKLIEKVTAVMASLNKAAAALMAEWHVRACTDITGFGLLGHALEMARASDVTLEIDAASVPVISGIRDLLAQGVYPGGSKANLEYLAPFLETDSHTETLKILCDAQTSGGLLMSLPEENADRFLKALHAAGVKEAALVGKVCLRGASPLRVL